MSSGIEARQGIKMTVSKTPTGKTPSEKTPAGKIPAGKRQSAKPVAAKPLAAKPLAAKPLAAKPVAPRRASIGARRNPETEAAVLAAARELLVERGYAGFSIDEVARRAGAGKPTIYRWWSTKADLFVAVYSAEKAAAVVAPDLGDLRSDLNRYTMDLWRFWRGNPAGSAFRGLVAEAQGGAAALDALRHKFLGARLESARGIFVRAALRGEIAESEVEDRLALWVGFNWYQSLTEQIDDESIIARRVDLLCR
jgi:AcrR family transcriptional regulator